LTDAIILADVVLCVQYNWVKW